MRKVRRFASALLLAAGLAGLTYHTRIPQEDLSVILQPGTEIKDLFFTGRTAMGFSYDYPADEIKSIKRSELVVLSVGDNNLIETNLVAPSSSVYSNGVYYSDFNFKFLKPSRTYIMGMRMVDKNGVRSFTSRELVGLAYFPELGTNVFPIPGESLEFLLDKHKKPENNPAPKPGNKQDYFNPQDLREQRNKLISV